MITYRKIFDPSLTCEHCVADAAYMIGQRTQEDLARPFVSWCKAGHVVVFDPSSDWTDSKVVYKFSAPQPTD